MKYKCRLHVFTWLLFFTAALTLFVGDAFAADVVYVNSSDMSGVAINGVASPDVRIVITEAEHTINSSATGLSVTSTSDAKTAIGSSNPAAAGTLVINSAQSGISVAGKSAVSSDVNLNITTAGGAPTQYGIYVDGNNSNASVAVSGNVKVTVNGAGAAAFMKESL